MIHFQIPSVQQVQSTWFLSYPLTHIFQQKDNKKSVPSLNELWYYSSSHQKPLCFSSPMTLCLPWQADFPISVVSSSTSVFLSTEYIKYSKNSTTASKKEACPSEEIGFQTWGGGCDWNKDALVLARRYKNNSATATRVLFQSTCKKIHNQLYNIQRDIPQTCIQLEGRLLMLKFIKK